MIRVGVVVQRYGREIVGGAETLARDVAERLNASGCDVTVFTTTASDYITWRNEFPAGESILRGVRILRFLVERERDIHRFNRYSEEFFSQPSENRDEMRWIREQGPDSPALIQALERDQAEFDVFIFFTYLYSTTVQGLRVMTRPVALFPTAHDEPPLHLNLMRDVFQRPDRLLFLMDAEKQMVRKVFGRSHGLELVRTGLVVPDKVDAAMFRRSRMIFGPYMLYAGRIERGKGLENVFNAFAGLRRKRLIDLVLIGKKLMDIPDIEGIRYAGFVSEEEKLSAFRGAAFSLQPSPLESLSITTLESFGQGTPVLANGHCAVLAEHIRLSDGGLLYHDAAELEAGAIRLLDSPRLRREKGRNGSNYVRKHFDWDRVIQHIRAVIREISET